MASRLKIRLCIGTRIGHRISGRRGAPGLNRKKERERSISLWLITSRCSIPPPSINHRRASRSFLFDCTHMSPVHGCVYLGNFYVNCGKFTNLNLLITLIVAYDLHLAAESKSWERAMSLQFVAKCD